MSGHTCTSYCAYTGSRSYEAEVGFWARSLEFAWLWVETWLGEVHKIIEKHIPHSSPFAVQNLSSDLLIKQLTYSLSHLSLVYPTPDSEKRNMRWKVPLWKTDDSGSYEFTSVLEVLGKSEKLEKRRMRMERRASDFTRMYDGPGLYGILIVVARLRSLRQRQMRNASGRNLEILEKI